MKLTQLISDEEKFSRIRKVIKSHLDSKSFKDYAQLADYIDYSKNTLYQMMAGTRPPTDILIYKFCEYYEYAPAFFFGRSDKLTSIGKPANSKKEDLLKVHESLELTKQLLEEILNKK